MPALLPLKRRADFLAVNGGARAVKSGFILLGRARGEGHPEAGPGGTIRYGLTATKKLGKAVERNRARRRLRALAKARLPVGGRPGWDYVIIARKDVLTRSFDALQGELESALEMLHKARLTTKERGHGRA